LFWELFVPALNRSQDESLTQNPRVERKRILLADDHLAIIEEIRALLKETYDVVGAVENGKTLVEAAQRLNPDLIICDISMPLMNGFEAVSKIRALGLPVRVIFLSVQSSAAYLKKARSLGASGYVLKVYSAEQLPIAISKVLTGETYFSPQLEPGPGN
jgi:DNA-binding NarL/FixJ family response regulator